MRLFAFLAPAALLAAAPALSAEPTADVTAVATQAKPAATVKAEKPKKICRLSSAATGSRLAGRRVCRTKDEWAELDSRDTELGRVAGVRAVPPPPVAGPGR